VKTDTFGAFVRHDKIDFIGVKLALEAARRGRIGKFFIAQFPRYCGFIYGGVWAFRLASATVNAIGGDTNCHRKIVLSNTD
jgi:hypothetical protein